MIVVIGIVQGVCQDKVGLDMVIYICQMKQCFFIGVQWIVIDIKEFDVGVQDCGGGLCFFVMYLFYCFFGYVVFMLQFGGFVVFVKG